MEFSSMTSFLWLIAAFCGGASLISGFYKRKSILKQVNFGLKAHLKPMSLILIIGGMVLIAVSLAGPQVNKGFINIEKKTCDIYFLMDVSKSMDSDDIKPSRLEKAKDSIRSIIKGLKGDKVGIIPFASDAYIQMPLTDDYDIADMFIDSIDTNMISGGGTNIKEALRLAGESFSKAATGEKVVIVLSDGEEHNNEALDQATKMDGTKIYTIGIGTEKGSLIPEKDETGNVIGYKKDEAGNFVTSRINGETLRKLAEAGKGKAYISTIEGFESERILKEIYQLKRGNMKEEKIRDYDKVFQYFLFPGLILFIIGYFLRRKDLA